MHVASLVFPLFFKQGNLSKEKNSTKKIPHLKENFTERERPKKHTRPTYFQFFPTENFSTIPAFFIFCNQERFIAYITLKKDLFIQKEWALTFIPVNFSLFLF